MYVIAKDFIDHVYTGVEIQHDPNYCNDCKAKKPCQYTAEPEFYKIGSDEFILKDTILLVEWETESHVRLRNTLSINYNVVHDVKKEVFKTSFVEYEKPVGSHI